MNNLPVEIYHNIFQFLNLNDLLNLRLVSKRIEFILKGYRIKELNIYNANERSAIQKKSWWFTNQSIEHSIDTSKLLLMKSSLFNIKLKRLRIILPGEKLDFNIDLLLGEELSKFDQIEHLEISLHRINLKQRNIKFSLPNLKVLQMQLGQELRTCIELETPNLKAIGIKFVGDNSFGFIKFNYPLSIQHLNLTLFNNEYLILKNLVYLVCDSTTNLNSKVIENYENLKELHYDYDPSRRFEDSFVCAKQDLKIYKKGVLLLDGGEFIKSSSDSIRFSPDNLRLIMNNYSNSSPISDSLDCMKMLEYAKLIKFIKNKELIYSLPLDFFERFNIEVIYVRNIIKDQNQLIQFVQKCKNLSYLNFQNTRLKQAFFDELPRVSSLNRLDINENKAFCLVNYNFIGRMFNLIKFETNKLLKLTEEINLNQLHRLKEFKYRTKNCAVFFKKVARDHYFIPNYTKYGLFHGGMQFSELINWSNNLNNESLEPKAKKMRTLF